MKNLKLTTKEHNALIDRQREENHIKNIELIMLRLGDILEHFEVKKIKGRNIVEFIVPGFDKPCRLPNIQRDYVVNLKTKDGKIWASEVIDSVLSYSTYPTTLEIGATETDMFLNNGMQRIYTMYLYHIGEFSTKRVDPKTGKSNEYSFSELDDIAKNKFYDCRIPFMVVTGSETAVRHRFLITNKPQNPMSMGEYISAEFDGPLMDLLKRDFGNESPNAELPVPNRTNMYYNKKDSPYYIEKYFMKKPEQGYYKGDSRVRGNYIWYALLTSACVEFKDELRAYTSTKRCKCKGGFKPTLDESYNLVCRYLTKYKDDPNEIDVIHTRLEQFITSSNRLNNNPSWHLSKKKTSDEEKRKYVASQPWPYLNAMYICDNGIFSCDENLFEMTEEIYDVVDNINHYSNTVGLVEWVLRGCKKDERCKFLTVKALSKDARRALFNKFDGIDILTGKRMDINDLNVKGMLKVYRVTKPSLRGKNDVENTILLPEWSHNILTQTKRVTDSDIEHRCNAILHIISGWKLKHPNTEIPERFIQAEMKKLGIKLLENKDYNITK